MIKLNFMVAFSSNMRLKFCWKEQRTSIKLKSPDIKILKLIFSTACFPPTVFTLKVRGKEISPGPGGLRPVWESYTVRQCLEQRSKNINYEKHLEKPGPSSWQMNRPSQLSKLFIGQGDPQVLCGRKWGSQEVISRSLLAGVIIKFMHITTQNSNLLGQKHRYHNSAASATST